MSEEDSNVVVSSSGAELPAIPLSSSSNSAAFRFSLPAEEVVRIATVVAGLVHPSNTLLIPSSSAPNNPIMFPGTGFAASSSSTVSMTTTSSTSSSSNAPPIPTPAASSAASGSSSGLPFPTLPVNPLLITPGPVLPPLSWPVESLPLEQLKTPPSSLIVVEGIPPIQASLIEKIRRWEYIDLAKLLGSQDSTDGVTPVVIQGHLVMMEPNSRGQRKQPSVNDILSWMQAYSRFMAVLLASESTSKEEAAGLAAHMHLIIQLSKDLEGTQWLIYDREFRQWAAAKGVKKWGEINFSIYGRCLSLHKPVTEKIPSNQLQRKGKKVWGACFKWNDNFCDQACGFRHVCSFCGGPHRRPNCPSSTKRAKPL